MLTDLSLSNFRGTTRLRVDGLRQFTILTGANNCGKTTLLEAAALFTAIDDGVDLAELYETLVTHRGVPGFAADNVATGPDGTGTVGSGGRGYELRPGYVVDESTQASKAYIQFRGSPQQRTFYRSKQICFVAAESSRDHGGIEAAMTFAEKSGHRRAVMELLRRVDPSITDLRILIGERNEPVLHAITDRNGIDTAWPVALAGSGFKRLLTLLCQVSGAKGLVCVDDPEAHMHPKLFKQLATVLWQLVDNGAQVMLATHSLDLIAAIVEPINGTPKSAQLGIIGLARERSGVVTCQVRQKGGAAQLPQSREALRDLLEF